MDQSVLGGEVITDRKLLSDLQELLQFNNPYGKEVVGEDHDYSQTSTVCRKRARTHIVPPIDDTWPPPKRPHTEGLEDILEIQVNKSRLPPEESKKVIVQLTNDEEVF